jgi:hypothetical protein
MSLQLSDRIFYPELLALPLRNLVFIGHCARRFVFDRALEIGMLFPETPDTIFNSHECLSSKRCCNLRKKTVIPLQAGAKSPIRVAGGSAMRPDNRPRQRSLT